MIESIEAQSRALQVGKASNVGLISGTSGHRRPNGAAQMLPTLVLPQMTNWWKCVITLLRLSVFVSMYRRLCILFLHIDKTTKWSEIDDLVHQDFFDWYVSCCHMRYLGLAGAGRQNRQAGRQTDRQVCKKCIFNVNFTTTKAINTY